MRAGKHLVCFKWNVRYFLLFELLVVLIYGLAAVLTFSGRELVFEEKEMQLKNQSSMPAGNYLDTSYTDTEAVVTPAFRLQKGIYYIEASFARQGIVITPSVFFSSSNVHTFSIISTLSVCI